MPLPLFPAKPSREGPQRGLAERRRHFTTPLNGTSRRNRPPFRPHFSATPQDQTDPQLRDSLKAIDMRDYSDAPQQLESFF